MKLQFKHKTYQADAVDAVVDCFAGQPKVEGVGYRLDPGKQARGQKQSELDYGTEAFRNAPLMLDEGQLLGNIQKIQRGQNLPQSTKLVETKNCKVNLDVEMETGTGKTYCYIRSMFELNRRYGWSKFIVVVPSIAIREGVQKSLEITAEHFLQDYGKKARFFTYDSKHPHKLESFSSDGGLNVMIINVQAFNATGKDARRIYEELDDFQSRRPIDVIKANHPILILDEPQKMEGKKTTESFKEFNPLFVLRYSATHKTEHNKIHRLDALDAYNQKLVKKIRVHGIAQKGLSGTSSYLYLEGILPAKGGPVARLEHETKLKSGIIKRIPRKVSVGYNLKDQSGGLSQYDGFTVSEIDAVHDTVSFTNGVKIGVGTVSGDINESALRRIQIRETIRAHFEAEKKLFDQGIKVLSLFFIDGLRFQVKRGEQSESIDHEDLADRKSFTLKEQEAEYMKGSIRTTVSYDLIGEIAGTAQLTRRTVAAILQGLELPVFDQFKANPEAFINKAATLIREQKASMIIEHLAYDPIDERYDSTIFAVEKAKEDFSKAYKANNHIYDYVFTDSKGEREFVEELDTSAAVTVYAKLPRGFAIPTPVGDYNPDWAIAFDSGKVKHVYFIAETKGSMSKLDLRPIEESKISCAKKFFAKISDDQVKYDMVNSYEKLMEVVR